MRQRRERLAIPSNRSKNRDYSWDYLLAFLVTFSSGAARATHITIVNYRVTGAGKSANSAITRIYDRNGHLLYTAFNNRMDMGVAPRTLSIYSVMQDAMIAAEDHTFWDNAVSIHKVFFAQLLSIHLWYRTERWKSINGYQISTKTRQTPQLTLQRKIPEAARNWADATVS